MKKSLYALVATVGIIGMSASAIAANPTAAEQTSSEQVQMCRSNTSACREGDQNACTTALKTCVGKERRNVIQILEEG